MYTSPNVAVTASGSGFFQGGASQVRFCVCPGSCFFLPRVLLCFLHSFAEIFTVFPKQATLFFLVFASQAHFPVEGFGGNSLRS